MSQPSSSGPVGCASFHSQQEPPVKMTPKIFVSGLIEGDGDEDLRLLFSAYGEVIEVVVDSTCATVTFKEEEVVRQLEEHQNIVFGDRKLSIARVLEEQVEDPFYIDGAPTSYPYQEMVILSSSYSSYPPPSYPMWYPPTSSNFYDPVIADCGPVHQVPPPILSASFNQYSVPPPTPTEQTNYDSNVFSFDITTTLASQTEQFKVTSSSILGCCHVCSAPSVQGVAPLQTHTQSYGNQLQPLTHMTPSLHTGYMYPPTPTLLPAMTPTYYLPATPSYMVYHPHGQSQIPDTAATLNHSFYTKIKPSYIGKSMEENLPNNHHDSSMIYFTSPFKRFTKFSGTPSKARFPIQAISSPQSYRGRSSQGSSRGGLGENRISWYQQGDRWGQKSGVDKEFGPDLVRDCNQGEGRIK